MKEFKLKATTQRSYYGKATVLDYDNKVQLKSYDTIVCEIINNGDFVKLWNGYSATTMKHINDFRRLYNFEPINKKAWDNLPCENTEKYKIVFSNGFVKWKPSTVFDDEDDAYNYAEKVSESHNWNIGYDVISCKSEG